MTPQVRVAVVQGRIGRNVKKGRDDPWQTAEIETPKPGKELAGECGRVVSV